MQELTIILRQVTEKYREIGGENSSRFIVLLEWTENEHFYEPCKSSVGDTFSKRIPATKRVLASFGEPIIHIAPNFFMSKSLGFKCELDKI